MKVSLAVCKEKDGSLVRVQSPDSFTRSHRGKATLTCLLEREALGFLAGGDDSFNTKQGFCPHIKQTSYLVTHRG